MYSLLLSILTMICELVVTRGAVACALNGVTGACAGGRRNFRRQLVASKQQSTYPPTISTRAMGRTIPTLVSLENHCDYIAMFCLRAQDTGKLCARTLQYVHITFVNHCQMDFVNCNEGYELWQVAYMGECMNRTDLELKEIIPVPYQDDYFLDQYYALYDDFV